MQLQETTAVTDSMRFLLLYDCMHAMHAIYCLLALLKYAERFQKYMSFALQIQRSVMHWESVVTAVYAGKNHRLCRQFSFSINSFAIHFFHYLC